MFRAKLRTLVCKPPVNCSVTHKPLDNKNNGTCYDCYQFVIKRLIEIAETRINTGFFKQLDLFPLDRSGGLRGDIVHDAVYAGDLVYDTAGSLVEDVIRDARPVSGHKVARGDAAQREGVIVGAAVAHDADRAGVGQNGEVLVDLGVQTCICDLLTENRVRLAQNVALLLGDLAGDADAEAGTRERLAHNEILRQTELKAELTDLVLEQHAQRLDDLLEVDEIRQTADIVMALDDGCVILAGLDDVRINGALCEVIHLADLRADLLAHLLEGADELRADRLALVLGVGQTLERGKELVLFVHADEVEVPLGERLLDLVALVLAHQAVVDEDAGELVADGLCDERGGNGAVHAAGQGQQDLAAADLLADGGDGGAHIVAHVPGAGTAADAVEEVADHILTMLGVVDLRVELHAVEAAGLVSDGAGGAMLRDGTGAEALGQAGDEVAVAHPGDALLGQALEQAAGGEVRLRAAVFAGRAVLRGRDLAAECLGHELAAVADAEDRHAQREDGGIDLRGGGIIDAVRAAGEDKALGLHGLELLQRGRVGLDLAVYIALTDTAGDELVILPAEVQNENRFHAHSSRKTKPFSSALSMMASECSGIPASRRRSPPCWKPFSTATPMPTSSAPASFTMSHRPRMASPRAMKSSMMRTLSEALSHSLETSSVTFFL